MIALPASPQRPASASFAMPASRWAKRPASSGSPMTPVEARNISVGLAPTAFAAASPVIAVVSRPFLPVKALALPEFTTSARALPPGRFCRQKSTGADGHFERVNTPAAVVPSSNTISRRSVRFLYLMPAWAVAMRTPSIAGMRGCFFGASGETVSDMGPLRNGADCAGPVCQRPAPRARRISAPPAGSRAALRRQSASRNTPAIEQAKPIAWLRLIRSLRKRIARTTETAGNSATSAAATPMLPSTAALT